MLVILDRDGVINADSPNYIKSPDEWIALPGSLTAIARLNQTGLSVVVATNQSGVGRGYYSLQTLAAIHEKMQRELQTAGGHIDRIYYCPHTPEDGCDCRKPKPGMLHQIQAEFPTQFNQAVMVGDSLRDIQAAHQAGCRAVLVKTGKGEKTLRENPQLSNIPVHEDLLSFVKSLQHP